MGTRLVRIPASSAEARLSAGRWLDPARTAVMVAVSGLVLAGSLLIASLSASGVGGALSLRVHSLSPRRRRRRWSRPSREAGGNHERFNAPADRRDGDG